MVDKVQKIKEEIERLEAYPQSRGFIKHMIAFIDSLPEEPKCIYNRTIDERKKFCKYCSAACDVRIEEEPASEDLEEVADNYAQQHNELLGFDCDCEPIQTGPEIKKAVIFGAEWQKQQMMKDAMETTIVNDWQYGKDPDHAVIPAINQRIEGFNVDGKVKIIIVEG